MMLLLISHLPQLSHQLQLTLGSLETLGILKEAIVDIPARGIVAAGWKARFKG